MKIPKLVSGGQTGADIAALDFALKHDLPHGGWCPKERRSLEGPIPAKYLLTETPSDNYLQRTEWNVRDSDGTVVFTIAQKVSGGSFRTIGYVRQQGKPMLHLSKEATASPVRDLQMFVRHHRIRTLNVVGSRESMEPGIHDWATDILEAAFIRGSGE